MGIQLPGVWQAPATHSSSSPAPLQTPAFSGRPALPSCTPVPTLSSRESLTPSMWVFSSQIITDQWGFIVTGGTRKFGVRQLPWGNEQEKEEPGEQQQARPGQVPVLQQSHQSWAGWRLQDVKVTFFVAFKFSHNCTLHDTKWDCALWFGDG